MVTALVTGATGFIGSHLVRALLQRGYTVRCLVRRTSDLTPLDGLPVSAYVGDLTQPATLTTPVQGVDYVFHCAAALLVTSREEFEAANTQGTINLLAAAEQHAGASLRRFLFVSSQAAVGPGVDTTPKDETAPLAPMSWYGSSKKAAEEAARQVGSRLPVTIVRPSSVYGEREKDLSQTYPIVESHIHPKLGLLSKYLVMVYVGDVVDGIIGAAESPATAGQTYFLNHPQVLSATEVIKTIAQAMGKPWGLLVPVPLLALKLTAPFAEFVYHYGRDRAKMTRDKAREVSQRFWVASPAKAQRDFGWQASHTLLEGMRRTIPAYRAERYELHAMPLERGIVSWLKFVFMGMGLGVMIETISAIGKFYWFNPSWLAIVVALGGFGVVMGSVAMAVKNLDHRAQFLIGCLIVGGAELVNELGLHFWQFAPGWPFGITTPWVRVAVLAVPGGAVVLLLNAVLHSLYRKRLRVG